MKLWLGSVRVGMAERVELVSKSGHLALHPVASLVR
jgi:hypothetical protein